MAKAVLLYAAAVCVLATAATAYVDTFLHDGVHDMRSRKWDAGNLDDGKVHFVKFYAPWCLRSVHFASKWKELGDLFGKLHEKVAIGQIDCTNMMSKDICTMYGIKRYPTIKVIYQNNVIMDYTGSKEVQDMQNFVEQTTQQVLAEV